MKVNKVILASNNNDLYYPFWNILSKLYKTKFGIDPVLIFLGTEEEKLACELSSEYGEIILCDIKVEGKLAWECTWALFYFTKFFLDDNCLIMGIDQIPTGTYFFDLIKDIEDDSYIMLTDDAYKNSLPTWENGGISPSAYHVAKGRVFNEIYKFEETFEQELDKIRQLNLKTMWAKETGSETWGYDETYSSMILFKNKENFNIVGLSKNQEFIHRRIDCYRNIEVNYNTQALNNNFYIECHSCRPYKKHKNWIDTLVNNIPNFINKN